RIGFRYRRARGLRLSVPIKSKKEWVMAHSFNDAGQSWTALPVMASGTEESLFPAGGRPPRPYRLRSGAEQDSSWRMARVYRKDRFHRTCQKPVAIQP